MQQKFKDEDLSQHITEEVLLMFGTERLQNHRHLFAYGMMWQSFVQLWSTTFT